MKKLIGLGLCLFLLATIIPLVQADDGIVYCAAITTYAVAGVSQKLDNINIATGARIRHLQVATNDTSIAQLIKVYDFSSTASTSTATQIYEIDLSTGAQVSNVERNFTIEAPLIGHNSVIFRKSGVTSDVTVSVIYK